jgi:hypothetical protein
MPEHQIQLCYVNSFASIWEYDEAIRAGDIDLGPAIGPRCPICGGMPDWGPIASYYRGVVELFPFREGQVRIARFRCGKTGQTFSLLPHQLAPYHSYTSASMLTALLLAHQVLCIDKEGVSQAVAELPSDCNVTPWLLMLWLRLALRGLRRAHAELAVGYELGHIRSANRRRGQLEEVAMYLQVFAGTGPGPPRRGADRLVLHHARRSRFFLLGTPSQHRHRSV